MELCRILEQAKEMVVFHARKGHQRALINLHELEMPEEDMSKCSKFMPMYYTSMSSDVKDFWLCANLTTLAR